MSVRVRFAPSPTGALHIGGARTALFNWLFARHHNGVFVLRIEDTDRIRSTDEALKAIYNGMEWLGLNWDEGPKVGGKFGPYLQTERMDLYKGATDKLLTEEKAYPCFCSAETLAIKREEAAKRKEAPKYDGTCRNLSKDERATKLASGLPYVIRFKTPIDSTTDMADIIRGKVSFDNNLLDDFVIVKSDGFPTYNFAVTIDDSSMEISHIIRGDDHISNSPRQILIYQALGLPLPQFAHIPMILGSDKARLSKRHGATSVIEYKEMGYLPHAVINYIAKLGWGYKDEEIFSLQDLIEKFDLSGVSKNPAIFNMEKLNWLNGHYIRTDGTDKLFETTQPLLQAQYGEIDKEYGKKVVALFLDRIKLFPEIVGLTEYFFRDNFEIDEKAKKYLEDPCRAALTGRAESPGIYDLLETLGKEKSIERIIRYV